MDAITTGQAVSIRQAFRFALLPILALFLIAPSSGHAQVPTNITPTTGAGNLGTSVNQVGNSFNITGGTRPGGGPNLFHSFANFSVGVGDVGNFLNTTPNIATSNILGRVTGGNISNIFGTIQTASYPNANLFLMNPSGFVFGPTASLNVGGSVSFTTAQYIRLMDALGTSANFYANPASDGLANSILTINASAFEFLSASPAAYGFLSAPDPNATITVQGSALSVPSGQSISIVGGDILIQAGSLDNGTPQAAILSAPSGRINLASVASAGEVLYPNLQFGLNVSGGNIAISQGAILDVSGSENVGSGVVVIRGGQLTIDQSSIIANTVDGDAANPGIDIQVSENLSLINGTMISSSTSGAGRSADIAIVAGTAQMDGALITSGTTGNGNGGNITLDATTLTLTNGGTIFSSAFGLGGGGKLELNAGKLTMDTGAQIVTANGDGVGGDIVLNVGTASFMGGSSILSQSQSPTASGHGGNVTIRGLQGSGSAAESVGFSGDSFLSSESQLTGGGGAVTITSNSLKMDGSSTLIKSSANDVGSGGNIELNVQHANLSGGATIQAFTGSGELNAQPGPTLTIHGVQAGSKAESVVLSGSGSGLISDSFGTITARAGDVAVHAKTISLTDGAVIRAGTPSTSSAGGNVTLDANSVDISSGSLLSSQSSQLDAGKVTITTKTLTLNNASITTQSTSEGKGGDVVLQVGSASLSNGATINSSTTGTGRAGDVLITAGQSVTLDSSSSISANTIGQGNAGNVQINAGTVTVANGSQINTSASIPEGFSGQPSDLTGNAGSIEITTTGGSVVVSNGGTIASSSQTGGNAGQVIVTTPSLTLDHGSITTNTSGSGNAGSITANVGSLALTNGAEISSNSTGTATGAAGSVTIQGVASPANAVTVTDSSILTSASNTGQGGSITVDATNLSLNNATMSASVNNFDHSPGSSDSATTGLANINLTASTMTMTGSTITTQSSGLRNAGDVLINPNVPGSSLEMQNSTINTSASFSDGGNIEINVTNMFQMTNSIVTSSVGNPTKTDTIGGNITIDPQNVIMQNSQIIAQAFAGTGGNISITSNVFLADPSSVVDASSTLGISGTVDIRSPVSNISGVIGRLPESVLAAQALLRAACAARLAESKVSSFVERGRDHIPVGPEGLLATPYVPAASEPTMRMGAASLRLEDTSGIQLRRRMGQDLTPRVHMLSGDAACQS
ncbi:MAG: protein of unknown function [Nitrospira sp.]